MPDPVRIKPHHFLDILTRHGAGQGFAPHPCGHAQHTIAARLLANPDTLLDLVLGADDICAPCRLLVDGRCTDSAIIAAVQYDKGDLNLVLDERWLSRLGLQAGQRIAAREYARLALERMGDLAALYPEWPIEGTAQRRERLRRGIELYIQDSEF